MIFRFYDGFNGSEKKKKPNKERVKSKREKKEEKKKMKKREREKGREREGERERERAKIFLLFYHSYTFWTNSGKIFFPPYFFPFPISLLLSSHPVLNCNRLSVKKKEQHPVSALNDSKCK